jgi:putative transposase
LGGYPCIFVSDDGNLLTSNAILGWQKERAIEWHCIAPTKSIWKRFVESHIGRLRDECLYEHLFIGCPHVMESR